MDKTYIVSVYGRANLIYSKLRDREIFYTYLPAQNAKQAVQRVWEEFQQNPEWNYLSRRDVRIEAEDWTGLDESYGSFGIHFDYVKEYTQADWRLWREHVDNMLKARGHRV